MPPATPADVDGEGGPPPVRGGRRSARDRVLDVLRRRIVSLDLAPGAAVSENDLSAELGVSRTPVRESLILLRREGLVEVFPQLGTFVTRVDDAKVAESQFVREAIECASIAAVPLPLPDEDAALLLGLLAEQDESAAAQDAERFFELDERFHRTLLEVAGHGSAWGLVNSVKAHLDRARRLSLVDTRPLPTLVEQHRAVVEALVAGDREAALSSLRQHLRTVFDDIAVIREAHPEMFDDGTARRPVRTVTTRVGQALSS